MNGGMNELALFAGAGGGILGGHLLGWNTVAACEIEDYPRETLLRRQLDGCLSRFPIWDDINTFDGKQFKGKVDIITGGFPCQDISAAGKGAGITGERSGLWGEMARIISEARPRFAFMENSPMLTSRGLGTVLGDLAEMGYNARWCVLGADDVGAPHRRKRIWILAYTSMHGCITTEEQNSFNERGNNSTPREKTTGKLERLCTTGINEDVAYTEDKRLQGRYECPAFENKKSRDGNAWTESSNVTWWDTDPADIPDTDKFNDDICGYGASEVCGKQSGQAKISGCEICNTSKSGFQDGGEPQVGRSKTISKPERPTSNGVIGSIKPAMCRVAHGVANRVDRLKAIGNGQVPAVAAIAFLKLSEDLI